MAACETGLDQGGTNKLDEVVVCFGLDCSHGFGGNTGWGSVHSSVRSQWSAGVRRDEGQGLQKGVVW